MLILDGGSTHVLSFLSGKDRDLCLQSPLWTSQALLCDPAAVSRLHKAYIEAGADIISCLTYQLSHLTTDADWTGNDNLYERGLRIALDACEGTGTAAVLTLGSHAAMLGNGSEYRHQYSPDDYEMLLEFHIKRFRLYASQPSWPELQYIAFETIPDVLEANVILSMLNLISAEGKLQDKKIWLSFSCATRDRVESLIQNLQTLMSRHSSLWGIGVNCFKDDVVEALLPCLQRLFSSAELKCILYPDNGQLWNAVARTFDGVSKDADTWALDTISMLTFFRADNLVLGGCCQTTPEHIKALRQLAQQS